MSHVVLKGVSQADLERFAPCSLHEVHVDAVAQVKATMALLGYKTNNKPAPKLVIWNGPVMFSEVDHVIFLQPNSNVGQAMHELAHAFSVKKMHVIQDIVGFMNPTRFTTKIVAQYFDYLSAPAEVEAHAVQFVHTDIGQKLLTVTKNRYAIKTASMYWIIATLVQEKILNRI